MLPPPRPPPPKTLQTMLPTEYTTGAIQFDTDTWAGKTLRWTLAGLWETFLIQSTQSHRLPNIIKVGAFTLWQVLFLFLFCFETRSVCNPGLSWNWLCRLDRPQTHIDRLSVRIKIVHPYTRFMIGPLSSMNQALNSILKKPTIV